MRREGRGGGAGCKAACCSTRAPRVGPRTRPTRAHAAHAHTATSPTPPPALATSPNPTRPPVTMESRKMRSMRGCPAAVASANWSRMFCGSATPLFSRMMLQVQGVGGGEWGRWGVGSWAGRPPLDGRGGAAPRGEGVGAREGVDSARGLPPTTPIVRPPAPPPHRSNGCPRLSAMVRRLVNESNSSSAMLQPAQPSGEGGAEAIVGETGVGGAGCTAASKQRVRHSLAPAHSPHPTHTLTGTAVCQLDCVGEVGCCCGRRAVAAAPLRARPPQQLGVNVHAGHVVDDAPDLQTAVLKHVAQQGGLAWRGGWGGGRSRCGG